MAVIPSTSVITTGPVGGEMLGAVAPNRLEINDFVKDERMFSLYIQALQVMMDTPEDDPISFFQVAGIHGLPYTPWNGAGEESPTELAGYCTHGSVLFPTWHRPYVSLYEQIIHKHAIRISRTYTYDGCCWRKAALDLRQPYWDWATNALPPPEVISMERVTITTPDGQRSSVQNPLMRYRFHHIDTSFAASFAKWPATVRYPTSTGSDAGDDLEELKATLQANHADFLSKTYSLLAHANTWPAFSCNAPGDNASASNSLEAIHDAIHDCVGGTGHMGDPAYAAFDPIFMLHHCQVDRLLSLWSALRPDVWVSKAPTRDGTFTIPPNSTVDENTPLTPFLDTQSTFWTSRGVTEPCPTQLGYSYPEFNGLNLKDRVIVSRRIAEVVNELYAPQSLRKYLLSAPANRDGGVVWIQELSLSTKQIQPGSSGRRQRAYTVLEVPAADDELMDSYLVLVPELPPSPVPNLPWEWSVRIRVKKYEVGSSFAVLIFLGGVPEDPKDWYTAPTYVGAHHAFVNSAPQRCANCRRQASAVTEGFVHLNESIAKIWAPLNSPDSETMRQYLRSQLSWRVRKVDGTALAPDSLASLEVLVVAQPVSLPEPGTHLLIQGTPEYHRDLTEGHVGGSYREV
ncbi:tyrosinase [Pilatotrama ljubarskyi]|nr:tyrosinase [Pilatotrama ljubarskyi]